MSVDTCTYLLIWVIKTFVTQWDAKAACYALGGFLARVKTVAQMNMLLDLVKNCPGYNVAEYYVDGSNANATDYYAPGAWTFVDGDPVPMSADFWGHGYPNNPDITHCLRMQNITANYKLDDCECARVCYYICEK
ncbi:hepatic lectin-like [Ruditapes philippinarum]|uniref:hepatic lectin-like n=1 Tax=Ruditapes philippinarum TaxID=129788 RepID=UPI00295BC24C|nr:hepatic lectin-like [Ruditapes philippinarum]